MQRAGRVVRGKESDNRPVDEPCERELGHPDGEGPSDERTPEEPGFERILFAAQLDRHVDSQHISDDELDQGGRHQRKPGSVDIRPAQPGGDPQHHGRHVLAHSQQPVMLLFAALQILQQSSAIQDVPAR